MALLRHSNDKWTAALNRLNTALLDQAGRLSPVMADPIAKWLADAAALKFAVHPNTVQPLTVVLGGTGTGKSTLVNRLTGATVTASSFRRTFTTGPVAVVKNAAEFPDGWMGVDHISATAGEPPRGQTGALVVVDVAGLPAAAALPCPLIDTPDLDGDTPSNHQQADRAFRWARRVVFVVTPEKYQMTELLPYYRMARRYAVDSLFVMNKCEEAAVVEDFVHQLGDRGWATPRVYVIPRDDAGFDPPADHNLEALRSALKSEVDVTDLQTGLENRVHDLLTRLSDQVLGPMRQARKNADTLIATLRSMETPAPGVDVNPITQQLQRRLQQRSVLYLVGPQRLLDRVRQMPTLLARLPRASWDWVMRGQMPADLLDPKLAAESKEPPDFPATLAEQFTVMRSRIDDVLRTDPVGNQWITKDADAYRQAMLDPATASLIATDEVGQLREWLEKRWNATPRDTRMLQSLLKYLPGGKKLTRLSEAAPYLLMAVIIIHHMVFPHELVVIGGYSLVTWLTERLSNEVSSRTRATNRRINERYEKLTHDQINRVCAWIDRQAPTEQETANLEQLASLLADE